MPKAKEKVVYRATSTNGNITGVPKHLWQAALNLRGSIKPADSRLPRKRDICEEDLELLLGSIFAQPQALCAN